MAGPPAFYPPGAQIPGSVYKVLRLLAQGGMGFVYDVEDVSVGKRYVLKTLTPELLGRRDLARRMEAEARILARLTHPNIVDVITAGTTKDDQRMPFFVMERLNGQSLRTVLDKKGALDLVLASRIGIDVLDALEHAHDNNVVHRDVKPDNVFLHRTPVGTTVTKLLDFGVMRLVDSNLDDTRGRFVGTLRYAAPEQVLAKEIGPAADLYATGLVLYEMLAGRGPWEEIHEMVELANCHVNEAPPPLSTFCAVPIECERLIMSSLAKDPESRPRDAFTFAAELRKIMKAAQRGSAAADGKTAVAPLSTVGNPGMAAGTQQPPSEASYDPLSALAAPSTDPHAGAQAFAKTLAGDPSTVREHMQETAREPAVGKAEFAATLRVAGAQGQPPGALVHTDYLHPAPGVGGVDRRAMTKSFVADLSPQHHGDTMRVDGGSYDPSLLPPERQSSTTSGLADDRVSSPPMRSSGLGGAIAVGLLSFVGVGALAWFGLRMFSPHDPVVTPAAELPVQAAASTETPPLPSVAPAEAAPLASMPAAASAAPSAPVPAAAHTSSRPSNKPPASKPGKPADPPAPAQKPGKPHKPSTPGIDF